ncbi:MAG: hypothetical protein F9K19_20080 [Rhizobiaceae bacterium]|nr:MAG: hypothetical protein F9K19_20080 [Rhizobiaceae bacterium]CAG0994915.1 hypothetical protein RHIZO_02458 [Rhizobiaceae bacterium]
MSVDRQQQTVPTVDGDGRLRAACRFVGGGRTEICRPAIGGESDGQRGRGRMLLDGGPRGAHAVDEVLLRALASRGLATRAGAILTLTAAGREFAAEEAKRSEPLTARPREIDRRTVVGPSGAETVPINAAESPLSLLARLKGRDGSPFISPEEREAGERLRSDFTRGQMLPRLGANWEASVATARRDGGAGGAADLTDAALAARLRVEKALVAVGPELAGVLVDICCFLKGIEIVEFERGWPARSAKLMLKTALSTLARHYRPPASAQKARLLHWGAEDYRPRIG